MYWGYIEQNWRALRGVARHQWSELTEEDLDLIAGRFDSLVETIEVRCRMAREDADKAVRVWLGRVHPPPPWRSRPIRAQGRFARNKEVL